MKWGIPATGWSTHFPAANTAAVVTVSGVADRRIQLARVVWSYSAAPTGGRLTVQDGATTVLDIDITAAGPAALSLEPISCSPGADVTITLAAGGASVTGKLNVAAVVE